MKRDKRKPQCNGADLESPAEAEIRGWTMLKDLKKHNRGAWLVPETAASVTGTHNAMPVALSVNADEPFRHRLISYPALYGYYA